MLSLQCRSLIINQVRRQAAMQFRLLQMSKGVDVECFRLFVSTLQPLFLSLLTSMGESIVQSSKGTAIAQWIRLHLPSASPGSSPKHTNYAFINLHLNSVMWKRRKNKKEAGNGPFKKDNAILCLCIRPGDFVEGCLGADRSIILCFLLVH